MNSRFQRILNKMKWLEGFIAFWHIECIRLISIGAHLSYKLQAEAIST